MRSPVTSSAAWFVTYSVHEVRDKFKIMLIFRFEPY